MPFDRSGNYRTRSYLDRHPEEAPLKKFRVSVHVEDDPFVEHSLWDEQVATLEVPDDITPFQFCNILQDYAAAAAEDACLHPEEDHG